MGRTSPRYDLRKFVCFTEELNRLLDREVGNLNNALELINKTNQFNITGRRWTKQGCISAVATGTRFIAFDVEDWFTRYGIVGVVVVRGSHSSRYPHYRRIEA
jgi:predicted enzyme involved in methoxymalonyl-ACP biosynthesis